MGFKCFVAVVFSVRCPAEFASPIYPCVLNGSLPHVSLGAIEFDDAKAPVGEFAAVEAAAGEQTRELGNRDAKKLLVHDVIDAFLQVGIFVCKPFDETLGRFAQKHARFTAWVQDLDSGIAPDLGRQHVQNVVGELRRRKDLVVAQVCQAGQNVRVVCLFKQASHGAAPPSSW